jgi:glycosyltransferase involved in cell wall biosynthesis
MKNNISLLVGLKNNLDYNKHFYETTRELYPDTELCFVSYGSTDGTHEWLESLTDNNLKYFYSEEQKTFSDTFNKAAELATKDYVAYLHNDIVLAPGFIENLEKHVSHENVVSYTTIEPPIFAGHERPGKLIYDLGTSLETFDKGALYEFVETQQIKYKDKTELGITFFMCMPRIKLLEIGGMDNLFNPMFCEDDDLIRRWQLLGMKCFTALDAICYHFVSKTSRFSEEYQNRTQQIELESNRNYIRKWGTKTNTPKYNIGILVTNCNIAVLDLLEPYCNRIYIDDEMQVLTTHYMDKEQSKTRFDLSKRIMTIGYNNPYDYDDIIVEVDAKRMTNQDASYIFMLPNIIQESGEVGSFRLGNLKITIQTLETYEKDLVYL